MVSSMSVAFAIVVMSLVVPTGAAAHLEEQSCRFVGPAYSCTFDRPDPRCDSEGVTGVAVGVGGVVSASEFGYDRCDREEVVTEASVAGASVRVTWIQAQGGCFIILSRATPAPVAFACPADVPPPNPGWGRLLP